MQALSQTTQATDRERELGAIITAYNDVTDRLKAAHERLGGEVARLREELKRKNAELRRRDRLAALGEMAAGLAHEVRNPLGGIALYASMLESAAAENPSATQAARKISHNVKLLDQLVREILDFAQEGRIDRRVCRLGSILNEVRESLVTWSTSTGADVVFDSAADNVEVLCDPVRMQRVLLNLLINGAQAAGQGGRVWLSATAIGADARQGPGVQILIEDDGPGIPREQLDRIFNPFFTTKTTGTGLGLAIVHRIVEAHGGTIRASNRTEGGAQFVIRLPSEQNKDETTAAHWNRSDSEK